jgi:hypothetical protein
MTAQVAERIIINGEYYNLMTEPLKAFWEEKNGKLAIMSSNTSNWRGYVGTWEIRNGSLYLINIEGESKFIDFKPSEHNKVKATWYSGVLRVPQGKLISYVHAGWGSQFEFDLLYLVENGDIKENRIIDNRPYYVENTNAPRIISSKDFYKYKELKIYLEEDTTWGFTDYTFLDLWDLLGVKNIEINDFLYHMGRSGKILLRNDVQRQLERLLSRGMQYEQAIEFLKFNEAPKTVYDRIMNLINEINLHCSWDEKVKLIDRIRLEFKNEEMN